MTGPLLSLEKKELKFFQGLSKYHAVNVEALNPEVLKKVIALLEKRDELLRLVDEMNQQIAALITHSARPTQKSRSSPRHKCDPETLKKLGARIRKAIRTGEKLTASVKATASTNKKAANSGTPHGLLKNAILTELQKAGEKGLTPEELSQILKFPIRNIQVWFSTTGKRTGRIIKNSEGRWVLTS